MSCRIRSLKIAIWTSGEPVSDSWSRCSPIKSALSSLSTAKPCAIIRARVTKSRAARRAGTRHVGDAAGRLQRPSPPCYESAWHGMRGSRPGCGQVLTAVLRLAPHHEVRADRGEYRHPVAVGGVRPDDGSEDAYVRGWVAFAEPRPGRGCCRRGSEHRDQQPGGLPGSAAAPLSPRGRRPRPFLLDQLDLAPRVTISPFGSRWATNATQRSI